MEGGRGRPWGVEGGGWEGAMGVEGGGWEGGHGGWRGGGFDMATRRTDYTQYTFHEKSRLSYNLLYFFCIILML